MGKQRNKNKTRTERPQSPNSIDWERRTRELVRAGIVSPLCLDNGGFDPRLNRRERSQH